VLEAPEQDYAPEMTVPRRTSVAPNRKLRRDFSEDFAEDFAEEEDVPATRRRGRVRVKFRGGLPRTKWGRIAAGFVVLVFLGLCAAAALMARNSLLHDERFVIQSSSAIEFVGNVHATREQLLNVFGEDLERNIFNVPLEQRRAELERMPWVEHATVMRLLPNRLRVSVVERTPVAFVRDGSHIGLVDANGILLDMPPGAKGDAHYSFPVVTGISASDPLSTRAARMKIFERFTGDLDGAGDKISQGLSEVDLSNPEDVKALIPNDAADVLVHFGEDDFLNRYKKFEEHLPEWRTQYPRLSSVDMRYERQVVLEMQPEPAASTAASSAGSAAASATAAPPKAATVKSAPATHPVGRSVHHAAVKSKAPVAHKPVAKVHPATKHVVANGKPVAKNPTRMRAVSEVAFSVPTKKGGAKSAAHPRAKGHPARHSGASKNHSSQAVHP
jgi:cell division protein FtsQ